MKTFSLNERAEMASNRWGMPSLNQTLRFVRNAPAHAPVARKGVVDANFQFLHEP
jgi:hypothetical protein